MAASDYAYFTVTTSAPHGLAAGELVTIRRNQLFPASMPGTSL